MAAAAGVGLDSELAKLNLTNGGLEPGYTHMVVNYTTTPPPTISCTEYINNMSDFIRTFFNMDEETGNRSREQASHETVGYIIQDIAVPIMCVFGIMGNILNLIVLTRKQIQCTMDRLEKSAHLGLVGLAVSDALFCLLYFLSTLSTIKTVYTQKDHIVVLYYNIYYEALTNIFLLSSTWLTVIMALGRYIAICHPFRARGFINLPGTRAAICCVYFGSVVVNLPKFWHYYAMVTSCDVMQPISNIPLPDTSDCSCQYYSKGTGRLYSNSKFVLAYGFLWSFLGIFLPLVLLTACNICLIRALRQSYQMQRMYRANAPRDSGHRITPTLVTIIILFTILVTPSEILNFFRQHIVSKQGVSHYLMFKTANHVANFMLLTNFAINFVLYCVINVQFRKVVRNIVCCTWRRKTPPVEYFKTTTHNSTTVCNISDMETEV